MTTPNITLTPTQEEALMNCLDQVQGGPDEFARRAVELAAAAKIGVEQVPEAIKALIRCGKFSWEDRITIPGEPGGFIIELTIDEMCEAIDDAFHPERRPQPTAEEEAEIDRLAIKLLASVRPGKNDFA